jgi:hypothetical protein
MPSGAESDGRLAVARALGSRPSPAQQDPGSRNHVAHQLGEFLRAIRHIFPPVESLQEFGPDRQPVADMFSHAIEAGDKPPRARKDA